MNKITVSSALILGIVLGSSFSLYYAYSSIAPSYYRTGLTEGETEGYRRGYQQGSTDGYTTGFDTGEVEGLAAGEKSGYSRGYNVGFTNGITKGREEGFSTGYSTGYDKGISEGYGRGYGLGYDGGYRTGNSTGFSTGYERGINDLAKSGFTTRNPTYTEAMAFVQNNQVDKHEYTDSYTCIDFTVDFEADALRLGYRVGFVYIEFQESAHAIACFNTTDRGIIFIEPQTDEQVSLQIGKPYFSRSNYLLPIYDDTILSYRIIW